MAENEQLITDLADVQPGDLVTFEVDGHRGTGEAYLSHRNLAVLGWILRHNSGNPGIMAEFVSATRPKPAPVPLPTEPGTWVLVHTVESDGDLTPPVIGQIGEDGDVVTNYYCDELYTYRNDVIRWQAVEVTPVGEVHRAY